MHAKGSGKGKEKAPAPKRKRQEREPSSSRSDDEMEPVGHALLPQAAGKPAATAVRSLHLSSAIRKSLNRSGAIRMAMTTILCVGWPRIYIFRCPGVCAEDRRHATK